MIKILLLLLLLTGCVGGGSSGSGSSGEPVSCLAGDRNCSDADVDLDAPVIWAADNGVSIVHIRWAGCATESAAKYAFERGVTIICLAGDGGREIVRNSPYVITVGSAWDGSNYGPGVDVVLLAKGTIHSGILLTALVATGRAFEDIYTDYPETPWKSDEAILIVDNGFDSVRPLYVLHKNPALAGKITGDYGVKAINELRRWVTSPVIGYVPFNTMPEARVDNWEIL